MASTLTNEDLVAIQVEMIKARVASDRLWSLQRQGRVGTFGPIDGNEAVTVAASWALEPKTDWIVPQYREMLALGRYGREMLRRFVAWTRGHPAGGHIPEPIRVFPTQIALAAQIPHAVGLAWAMQLKKEAGVVLVFFGDGASSEGDFYEAANMAGVMAVPVIFLCVNNQWAISTPTYRQTAAPSFATKAEAFGFEGTVVDGSNPIEVHAAVAAARDHALAGGGPSLIEAVTYRLAAHTTADDPSRYVPPDEFAQARRRDPLVVFRKHLEARGLWDPSMQADAEATGLSAVDEAWAWASNLPIKPQDLFDHVFDQVPARLAQQRSGLDSA